MAKTKNKGLKNPAAIMAVGKVAPTAKKINEDTGNSLSWLAVAFVGLGLYVTYKVVKTVGSATDVVGGVIDGIVTDPNSGGGNVDGADPSTGTGATINGVQAETIASQLANILGTWGKLNEREILDVLAILSGKTPVDYQMISNAFGMVRRNPITGEIAPPLMGTKYNLTDWLTYEMQPAGIARLKQVMPGVF